MNIRYGTTADAKMLSELGAKTFYDTLAKDNTSENMTAYQKKSFSPEIQHAELSNPSNIFLIVDHESRAIGYAQLILDSKEEVLTGIKPLEIRQIYALQEYIGKGVGKALMQAAIEEAKQRGCDSVWLGVWEKNPRAFEFYEKWGFKEVGTHIFTVGDDPQRDYILLETIFDLFRVDAACGLSHLPGQHVHDLRERSHLFHLLHLVEPVFE